MREFKCNSITSKESLLWFCFAWCSFPRKVHCKLLNEYFCRGFLLWNPFAILRQDKKFQLQIEKLWLIKLWCCVLMFRCNCKLNQTSKRSISIHCWVKINSIPKKRDSLVFRLQFRCSFCFDFDSASAECINRFDFYLLFQVSRERQWFLQRETIIISLEERKMDSMSFFFCLEMCVRWAFSLKIMTSFTRITSFWCFSSIVTSAVETD